ncbi:MAG TPA: hypothetical protein VFA04_24055 [Bryobacteraceae bacterium]|nr:hypothetical protein [Bryobacteraceae bacterium]
MKFIAAAFAVVLSISAVIQAQDRDFLTEDEIDQIRVAQDPNARLYLYINFAKTRAELVRQLMTTPKPGRSVLIHDTLEDYTHIIEAIDTVSDDALKRHIDISKGMEFVRAGEKEIAAKLAKLQENPPADYARYEFAMQQAVEATGDSEDLSAEDLGKRAADVKAADARDKKERESVMTAKEVGERHDNEKKAAPNGGRKAPTLMKPGEQPGPQQVQ